MTITVTCNTVALFSTNLYSQVKIKLNCVKRCKNKQTNKNLSCEEKCGPNICIMYSCEHIPDRLKLLT